MAGIATTNPFFYGDPVPAKLFFDRNEEIVRTVGRILSYGQSTAIVGDPRSGKTSLLRYLSSADLRTDLYGAEGGRLLFSFVDAQTLGPKFTPTQFWKYVLCPIAETSKVALSQSQALAEAIQFCAKNTYGTYSLERLFARMSLERWRLVVVLDEFDALLLHPVLHSGEFFGSLRSLASLNHSLALVIASRQPLTELIAQTEDLSRAGSPYFNFLEELTLGPLSDADAASFLQLGADHFTGEDREFVLKVTGNHLWLMQALAYELWELARLHQSDDVERRELAARGLLDKVAITMDDVWQMWSPAKRCAFAAAAIEQISSDRLAGRTFKEAKLLGDLRDFGPEMRELERRGYVLYDPAFGMSQWRVRAEALLWWFAEKIVRTVRQEVPFEDWIRTQGWEGFLTSGEKESLGRAINGLGTMLKAGVQSFIEAAAKGLGEGLSK